MGMVAILFNGAEPLEWNVNTPSTEGLLKSGENWSSGLRDENI